MEQPYQINAKQSFSFMFEDGAVGDFSCLLEDSLNR